MVSVHCAVTQFQSHCGCSGSKHNKTLRAYRFAIFSTPNDILFSYHTFNMLLVPIGERAAVPIPPPPESEWYHGRLDRYSAEQRLKTAYKLGSYLGKTLQRAN